MVNSVSGVTTFNPFAPLTAQSQSAAPASGTSSGSSTPANGSSIGSANDPNAATVLIGNAQLASSGARGALSGSSSVSVLGASLGDDGTSIFGSLPSQNTTIINQIVQEASQRFSDAKATIDNTAAQENATITAQNNQWISIQAQINTAAAAVSTGQANIETVSNALLGIRGSVSLAGTSGEDIKLRAGQFDDTFNTINNAAEASDQATNLVGSINPVDFSPNQIEYKSDPGLGHTVLTGTYIATAYRIKAADGTYWVPDLGSDSISHYSALQGVKQKVQTSGITLDETTSTRTGLKLVSYDPNTNAITMNVTINPADPPEVVSGTLERTGIGLMPSWFYDGLGTSSGRTRAYADINAAVANLGAASATLQTSANQTATDLKKSNEAFDALSAQSAKVSQDQLAKDQTLQDASVKQLTALENNLASLQSTQSNYYNLLAGAVDDPLGQSLVDLTA